MGAMARSFRSHNLAAKNQVVSGEIDASLPCCFEDLLLPAGRHSARLLPTGDGRCLAVQEPRSGPHAAKSAHHKVSGLK